MDVSILDRLCGGGYLPRLARAKKPREKSARAPFILIVESKVDKDQIED